MSSSTDTTALIAPAGLAAAEEREVDVLAEIRRGEGEAEGQSQRSIAKELGLSVGLTNAILKRLVAKGLVMMRRVNHNKVRYLVTPEGVEEITRRSYRYLRRTVGTVVHYRERLRRFCRARKAAGAEEIALIGASDLDFLVEWCARQEGLGFRRSEAAGNHAEAGTVLLYSERIKDPPAGRGLAEVLVGR
ncbi:MAG: winged helix-turn-helix transcriptional regulator [Spirochaetaceae bacterium]